VNKRVLLLALAVACLLLAGCGVPTDDKPQVIDGNDVPFQLLAPTTESTTTTVLPSGSAGLARVVVYLADTDGHLAAARREVEAPVTPAKVVRALLQGPTPDEASKLHTAITSETKLLDVDGPTDGLVTVDLSAHLLDITGRQQILALGQVVYTLTSLPDVTRVLFRFDGEAVEVPNGDGTLTAEPLGKLSYRTLRSD
jgi:spore germination protein GerM